MATNIPNIPPQEARRILSQAIEGDAEAIRILPATTYHRFVTQGVSRHVVWMAQCPGLLRRVLAMVEDYQRITTSEEEYTLNNHS